MTLRLVYPKEQESLAIFHSLPTFSGTLTQPCHSWLFHPGGKIQYSLSLWETWTRAQAGLSDGKGTQDSAE